MPKGHYVRRRRIARAVGGGAPSELRKALIDAWLTGDMEAHGHAAANLREWLNTQKEDKREKIYCGTLAPDPLRLHGSADTLDGS